MSAMKLPQHEEPALIVPKASYNVDEFCTAHGIGRTFLYEEIRAGRLKTKKAGRRTLIRAEDAKAWLDSLPDGEAQG